MTKNQYPSTFCLLGAAVLFVGAAAPSRAALIANWTFDADLTDAVGSKDATGFGGANFQTTTSKIGAGSATFDGVNDYMTAGTTSDFAIGTGTMSVSFWFNLTTAATSDRFLSTGAGLNDQDGWTFFARAGTGIDAAASDGGGRRIQGTTASPLTGTWHLAVGVFDQPNGTVDIYLDSVLESTIALWDSGGWNGSSIDNTFVLNFGRNADGAGNYLDGYLDDVAIWDAALSQGEIDGLWNGGTGAAAAIPEPSSAALIGLAGFGLLLRRRR